MKRPNPEDYMPMIYKLCNKYKTFNGVVSYDDIIGIAKLTLMKAIESYDPAKGAFPSYAKMRIRFGIIDELRRLPGWSRYENKRIVNVSELDAMPDADRGMIPDFNSNCARDMAEASDMRVLLDKADIGFRHVYVLRMLYINNLSITALAKEMKLSTTRVFYIRQAALKELRNYLFGIEEVEEEG